jgi:hypothetical protein
MRWQTRNMTASAQTRRCSNAHSASTPAHESDSGAGALAMIEEDESILACAARPDGSVTVNSALTVSARPGSRMTVRGGDGDGGGVGAEDEEEDDEEDGGASDAAYNSRLELEIVAPTAEICGGDGDMCEQDSRKMTRM